MRKKIWTIIRGELKNKEGEMVKDVGEMRKEKGGWGSG